MHVDVQQDSIWTDGAVVNTTALAEQARVDVCVVGAGIAGLSVAYQLARVGRRVLVLDDGPIGGGNTSRTTAHLSNVLDDRFFEVERVRGTEAMRLAAQSHAAAIDTIEETCQREGIDCGFRRVDGYLFAPSAKEADTIHQEYEAAQRAGLKVERLERLPLKHFETGPCLRFPQQGQFEPMRYLSGLAQAVANLGSTVMTRARARAIKGGVPATVTTKDGKCIEANAVVVATNTPVNDRVVMHTKQAPYLTYAVASPIPSSSVPLALYWDTLDPYHYVRLHTDPKSGTEYVIVGGEDHKTGQAHDQDVRWQRLTEWMRARFPQVGPVAYRWSGQVMETLDGLAFIGHNPTDEDNVYIATGDSAMGMTHGTIAGLLLRDLILGRSNPWKEVYAPARKPLQTLGEFLGENLNAAVQYGAWLTPGEVSSAEEVPAGQGAILRQGLHKLAVYRDKQQPLCVRSATCPHLGGIVAWNDGEKTWDCPLHGSRFDRCGKMINGPSNADLEEKTLT